MLSIAIGDDGLRASAWQADDFDFWRFDRRADELARERRPLVVEDVIAREVTIRVQRLCTRTNEASTQAWFRKTLELHEQLHDLDKPLVRADLDHAIDTWQWTLRLDVDASASVQLAALLHDIERLVSEAEARVEHQAVDYQAFKDAHARAGALLARQLLERAGVPASIIDDTCRLIAIHERRSDDADIAAINDADALSFFSLNSPGYLHYFGREQTAKKVAYTLARMSAAARSQLGELRLIEFIRQHVQRA
jgi:hypothetical protein